jgi:hypothetical protein
MGANAQIAVPAFTAGQILTAAQQTQINTGIPVFATTVTRDAAFGGAGEKTLAEGQFAFIEATNTTQYYDGAAWQAVGASALTFINRTSFSNVASQTFDNVFTSTYSSYLVVIENLYGATGTSYVSWQWRFGGTTRTAACNSAGYGLTAAGAGNNLYGAGVSECLITNRIGTSAVPCAGMLTVHGVGVSGIPMFSGTIWSSYDAVHRDVGGNCQTSATYDGFLIRSSSGNVYGTIAIYGLAKS